MPQPDKPASMSSSDWRLWCCCRPTVTPPLSSTGQSENISLEEFDPRSRLSMSRAYGQDTQSPPQPSTPIQNRESAPPIRHSEPNKTAHYQSANPQPEDRATQRPDTILLPNPPQRPGQSQKTKVATKEQSKPTFVRQDSETGDKWCQVGRRILDRKEKSASPKREDRERSDR